MNGLLTFSTTAVKSSGLRGSNQLTKEEEELLSLEGKIDNCIEEMHSAAGLTRINALKKLAEIAALNTTPLKLMERTAAPLIKAAGDHEMFVRKEALVAIAAVGRLKISYGDMERLAEALTAALADKVVMVRLQAIRSLFPFMASPSIAVWQKAKPVDPLIGMLKDKDEAIRKEAAALLKSIKEQKDVQKEKGISFKDKIEQALKDTGW